MFTRATLKVLPVLLLLDGAASAADLPAVAHPEEEFSHKQTVVWTPLFQAAWDRMNKDLGGPPIKVDPPNRLMTTLDSFEWKADEVMPKDRWKVWSGEATAKFVEEANREAAALTGEEKGPFVGIAEGESNPGARLVLALLDRELNFKKAFHRSATTPLAFKDGAGKETSVQFFGARGDGAGDFAGSVGILFKGDASHAVQLGAAGDESVVLYMPTEEESFTLACGRVRAWQQDRMSGEYGSAEDPKLHPKDDLRIPYVKLSQLIDFTPLLAGARTYQESATPWRVVKALQQVDFQMTEKGAKVKAKVEVGAEPFGEAPPPPKYVPRSFVYDKPFFVFLWRDGADWPYFAAWVGDASSLEAWK